MRQIFDNVIDLFTVVKPYIFIIVTMLSTVIALISSMLTCVGSSLPELFVRIRNWRDRKVIKYKILSAIYDIPLDISILKPYIDFSTDILEIYAILLIILVVLNVAQGILNACLLEQDRNAFISLIILVSMIILTYIISKVKNKENPGCIIYLILGNSVVFFIMAYLAIKYGDMEKSMLILMCLCIFYFILFEAIFKQYRFCHKLKSKKTEVLRLLRVFLATFYIIYVFCYSVNTNVEINHRRNTEFFCLWTLLCFIENIILAKKYSSNLRVQYVICMTNGYDLGKSKIYQYKGNKVKYISYDKSTKVIDDDEILFINYDLKGFFPWKRKNVSCYLKNGGILEFDGYSFIQDSWVSFYKIKDNIKFIKIINYNKIKKIICKN